MSDYGHDDYDRFITRAYNSLDIPKQDAINAAGYTAAAISDRDRYKAEAERWERVAQVLAKRAQFFNVAPEADYFNSEEGWLAWAEKEADGE